MSGFSAVGAALLKSRCWSWLQFSPKFVAPLRSSLVIGRIHLLVVIGLSSSFSFGCQLKIFLIS